MEMKEIIDLSHSIETGMLRFHQSWHPEVKVERIGTIPGVGRETRVLQIGTHSGTHIDAPLHFVEEGMTIDNLPLNLLLGPVTFLDFSHLGKNGVVTKQMLETEELTRRVIINYGWGHRWPDGDRFYFGYPFFSPGAADYLIGQGVELLGYDAPSPDDSRGNLRGGEADSPMHKKLLGGGVWLLEYLANLDRITDPEGWSIAALPLKIRGGDGAPTRVVLYR